MDDSKRNFVLGLGHQKCGTSWLYRYLCLSDIFAQGFTKEYHIWDKRDILLFKHKMRVYYKKYPKLYQQHCMENSDDHYFSYFDGLMCGRKVLAADITPSYSGLKSERLEYIKQKFLERDIETKVVVLFRDPLSRIKSAVRFYLDRDDDTEGIKKNGTSFSENLKHYYRTDYCIIRTRYEEIIGEVQAVFPSDNIFFGFYENLFTYEEITRLSNFLGIDVKLEFASIHINKGKKSVPSTKYDLMIKRYYKDTYDYCYENFPITRELWR